MIRTLVSLFKLALISRYKIEIKNSEILKYDGPSLVLPNHVALIDPVIVYVFLFPYVSLLPLASRKYYDKPIAGKIMKLANAIPIEDLQAG
jgi:1-acyl-sn-glycerol-3-phosphate acyltransferase